MEIIDLTVTIGPSTYTPPSVNKPVGVTVTHKEPGYWQVTSIEMALHVGSHVDFSKHYREDGETAEQVPLSRSSGLAKLFDLGELPDHHAITPDDLEAADPGVDAEIALIRTGWTDNAWGEFPRYYTDSPECSEAAVHWLTDRGFKAIGFDCFSEGAAKRPDYTPLDFIVHRLVGESGAVLMQSLTNLDALPRDRAVQFYAPFIKFEGAEGVPARFFAVIG